MEEVAGSIPAGSTNESRPLFLPTFRYRGLLTGQIRDSAEARTKASARSACAVS